MFKKAIGFCMALALTLSCVQPAFAAEAEVTGQPAETAITISNNIGTPDTVDVGSVTKDDIVKVYGTEKDTNPLAIGVVAESQTSITLYINQLGVAAGKVYVSVTSASKSESIRTKKDYAAETQTDNKLADGDIEVINNVTGEFDRVDIKSGITGSTIIRVYASASAATPIATTISSGTTASLLISQLGTKAGSVFVSIQKSGEMESKKVEKKYEAEKTSPKLALGDVTVVNNYKISDTVTIKKDLLKKDDEVFVYATSTATTPLGSGKAAADNAAVTVDVTLTATGGTAYVAVKSPSSNAGDRVAVKYGSEISPLPIAKNINVNNNYSTSKDTIIVGELEEDDVINVYTTSNSTTPVSATAELKDSKYSATIEIDQLGSTAGKVLVTLTKKNKAESPKLTVAYAAETATKAPEASKIEVKNNITDTDDIVQVDYNFVKGDVIKVYRAATGTEVLKEMEVTEDSATRLTISIPQIGVTAGKVYVTIKNKDALESTRTPKDYKAEDVTKIDAKTVKAVIENNAGKDNDKITVTGLSVGDVVTVYADTKSTGNLGIGTVSTGTSVEFKVTDLAEKGGKVYFTVKKSGTNESTRTLVNYVSEITATPTTKDIVIDNKYTETDDVLTFKGLKTGDKVTVYKDAAKSVNIVEKAADADGDLAVTLTLPTSTAGKVYVTLTKKDKAESACFIAAYKAETVSIFDLKKYKVETNNYLGSSDTIVVTGLSENDVIKVYKASTGGTSVADATAGADGIATINLDLGTAAGRVYLTVQKANEHESTRLAVSYTTEVTTAPTASNIMVMNNKDDSDTVIVSGLKAKDFVTVYDDKGVSLGTATVADGKTGATVDVKLNSKGGKILISVKGDKKAESVKVAKTYIAE